MTRRAILILLAPGAAFHSFDCRQSTPPDDNTPTDTTSHSFAWTLQTLGDGASSVLFDVSIINDTLAYAVGDVILKDSSGNYDPLPYNLAVWNGQSWKLRKLSYQGYPPVIRTVFAVNENDVWFDPWLCWDGRSFQEIPIDPMMNGVRINKMWAGSNGLYVVGNSGFIAHRSSDGAWQKLASGTTLDFHDIWGARNPITREWEILAVASNKYQNVGKRVLQISGITATVVTDSGLTWSLSSVNFVPGLKYYLVGDGVFECSSQTSSVIWQLYPEGKMTNAYSECIRGMGANDIFIVGDFGEIVHYNGKSWMNYSTQTGIMQGYYLSVALLGNLAIGVGQSGDKAIVAIGRR